MILFREGNGDAVPRRGRTRCNCRAASGAIAAREQREMAGAPRLSGVNTMRGRDDELRIASEILDRAERGQGTVLLIEGDPGTGKTGLLDEITHEATRRHFSLATGEADEIGRRTPFAPLLTALQDAAGGLLSDTPPPSAPESWAPVVSKLSELLERRAAASPLLVTLD